MRGLELETAEAQGVSPWPRPCGPVAAAEVLEEGEELDQTFAICGSMVGAQVTVGVLTARVSRAGSDEVLEFSFPVPPIPIVECPLRLSVHCNTVAYFGEALHFRVRLRNTTRRMQSVSVQASDSRSFFTAGRTACELDILPGQRVEVPYTLIPIQTGAVQLPPLEILSAASAAPILSAASRLSVFVYPKNPSAPCA